MMEFTIKAGATQPVLTMKVNKNNVFRYEKFQLGLENCAISFSMKDVETGIYKITKKSGGLIKKEVQQTSEILENEYYIYYKFSSKDTNKPGRYIAEFKIDFFDLEITDMTGTFISPIHDDLFINIKKSLFTETNTTNKPDSDSSIFTDEFYNTFQ